MKRFLAHLIFCLIPGLTLIAQQGDSQATFRIISATGSYDGLLYDTGSGSKKITVPIILNQALSPPLPSPEGSHLDIYRLIPPPLNAPPGTPPIRQVVISTQLPVKQSDCIVVTFPVSENRLGPLQARLVPPSPGSHQAGTLRIINFSSYDAGVAINEHQSTFAAGAIDVVKTGAGRVLLQVAVNKNGVWDKTFRAERRITPQMRGYVFIFDYRDDPDYGDPLKSPPAATVKTFFEVSPEAFVAAQKQPPAALRTAARPSVQSLKP